MKHKCSLVIKNLILIIYFLICFKADAQEIIQMKKETSGTYTIPCEVNGLKLRFIFDTGASAVSISLTEATFMLKNGYLEESDITGIANVRTADGKIAENYTVTLKELKIGSVTLNNVEAIVSNGLDAPLLLGQSALDKLGHWAIKNGNLVLNDCLFQENVVESEDKIIEYAEYLYDSEEKEKAISYLKSKLNSKKLKVVHKLLFWGYSKKLDEKTISLCNDAVLNYLYDSEIEKFESYLYLARFYYFNDNHDVASELYTKMLHFEDIPLDYLIEPYEDLYIMYSDTHPDLALRYAKEAFDRGVFLMAHFYGSALMERNDYKHAYAVFKKGHEEGHETCTYELANGYVKGYWQVKNLDLGLSMLDNLAHHQDREAIYDLCAYYLGKKNYQKVLYYAKMFKNKDYEALYEGIVYYIKKDYLMSFNRLNNLDPSTFYTSFLKSEYYGILGELYEKGLGCRPDFEKAYDCYQELIEYAPAWGYGMLGDMFFINELIETDEKRAYQY